MGTGNSVRCIAVYVAFRAVFVATEYAVIASTTMLHLQHFRGSSRIVSPSGDACMHTLHGMFFARSLFARISIITNRIWAKLRYILFAV